MSANHFCSTCETDKHLKPQAISTEFKIKGKKFPYTYEVLVCENCGEYVSSPEQNDEILKGAYDAYKSKNGLLLTDEIIAIRKKYDLTLRPFSKILGVSHITYHRYEKGAIPDPSIHSLLVLIKENPVNLKTLFELSKTKFKVYVAQKIQIKIDNVVNDFSDDMCSTCPYQQFYEQNYLETEAQMTLTVSNPYRIAS
jgi:putative zinc finger/helix-turn-helix YgiT family protein